MEAKLKSPECQAMDAAHEAGHIMATLSQGCHVYWCELNMPGKRAGRIHQSHSTAEQKALIAVAGIVAECKEGFIAPEEVIPLFETDYRYSGDRRSLRPFDFLATVKRANDALESVAACFHRLVAELKKPENHGRRIPAWELLRMAGVVTVLHATREVVPDSKIERYRRKRIPMGMRFLGTELTEADQTLLNRPVN